MRRKIRLRIVLIVASLIMCCGCSWSGQKQYASRENKELPAGFPHFVVSGESKYEGNYHITPHTSNHRIGWLIETNNKGEVLWYKELPAYAYLFRHFKTIHGENRYAYLQVEKTSDYAIPYSLENTHLVLMDDNQNIIRDHIVLLPYGSLSEVYPCDNHEYIVFDDDHYILTAEYPMVVDDIPQLEGKEVFLFNSIFQEQKDGEVVFQFESIHYPELYVAAIGRNQYSFSKPTDKEALDYCHINSIAVLPETGDYLVSFRNIGIIYLQKSTGKILWCLGTLWNDFENVPKEDVPLYQHDIRLEEDHSFTVFDNYGDPRGKSRVIRFWMDESYQTILRYEVYTTEYPQSSYMGSAQLLDNSNNTYLISYGSGLEDVAFEEYVFDRKKRNLLLRFEEGYDMFSITQGDTVFIQYK